MIKKILISLCLLLCVIKVSAYDINQIKYTTSQLKEAYKRENDPQDNIFLREYTEIFANASTINEQKLFHALAQVTTAFEEIMKMTHGEFDLFGVIEKQVIIRMEVKQISKKIFRTGEEFQWSEKDQKGLCRMIGLIFADWTLERSKLPRITIFDRPHDIQIISILRMLGADVDVTPSTFDWAMSYLGHSDKKQTMFNQIIEIKKGEGKPLVLGIVSIIFALRGVQVDTVCYRQYLSERDQKVFQQLFVYYGVENLIQYNTFEQLAEKILNDGADVRSLTLQMLQDKLIPIRSEQIIQFNQTKKHVIIVDEMDTFI